MQKMDSNLSHPEFVAFQGEFIRKTMASFQTAGTQPGNPQDFLVRFVVTRRLSPDSAKLASDLASKLASKLASEFKIFNWLRRE